MGSGALDARNLMKHQSTFGRVYQAALRAEVTRWYGVAWEPTPFRARSARWPNGAVPLSPRFMSRCLLG